MFESGHELSGNNLYAYCNNNPINMIDPDGESILITLSALATILAKAIVVTAVVTVGTYIVSGIGYVVSNIADNSSKDTTKNTKEKNTTNTKSKKQSKSLPTVSEPNTSLDLKGKDGRLKLRRYYGPDGRAIKDIDYKRPDDGTHKFPHEHDWNWDNGTPQRSKYSK